MSSSAAVSRPSVRSSNQWFVPFTARTAQRSREFIFADDLSQLDTEKAISALELEEGVIEGAIT